MLLKLISFCAIVVFLLPLLPVLASDENILEKEFLTAVCNGKPPGVEKFFKKDYDCNLNVSSSNEKKVTADCFKKVYGVDEPKSYQGLKELLCKNIDGGKISSYLNCEHEKLGTDAKNARDRKRMVSVSPFYHTTP